MLTRVSSSGGTSAVGVTSDASSCSENAAHLPGQTTKQHQKRNEHTVNKERRSGWECRAPDEQNERQKTNKQP